MGRLTTHVLDTAQGIPGAGIDIKLFSLDARRHLVATATTNADGRTEQPLLADETMLSGSYELEFAIGDYFAATGIPAEDPPFLGHVVVRFTISDSQSYHIPLLVSPWSYSTYRGS